MLDTWINLLSLIDFKVNRKLEKLIELNIVKEKNGLSSSLAGNLPKVIIHGINEPKTFNQLFFLP